MLNFYIISFVQIVLESLPVSSSGHLYLLQLFLQQSYSKELVYMLHVPTLIILLFFFRHQIIACIKEYAHKKVALITLFFCVGVVDALTTLFFIFFNRATFLKNIPAIFLLLIGFIITALILYSLRWCKKNNDGGLTLSRALVLGIVQGCALMPGISRFAAVYTASCWLGFSPHYAFSFTWLVQMPLIGAAVAKSVCFSSLSFEYALLARWDSIIALSIATVGGYCALLLSYRLACAERLWICAYYMMIPIVLTLFYINYYI